MRASLGARLADGSLTLEPHELVSVVGEGDHPG